MAKLGSLCQFINGGTPSKDVDAYFQGDIPWITSADITGPIADAARSFITPAAVQNSATNQVKKGTVLLVTRTGVGKVAIAGCDLCFSQDITAILPDAQRLDAGYLVHFLATQQSYFDRYARGATIKGITRDVVTDLDIPLPPLPEQRRIAAVLDKADALRAKRREALAQLDRLAQSIFVEMFGSGEFDELSIGQLIESGALLYHKDGNHGSLYPRAEEFGDIGIPFLSAKSIDDYGVIDSSQIERLNEDKARQLRIGWIEDGDVLLSHNASVGKVAIYDGSFGEALIGTSLTAYRPNPKVLNTTFLAESLRGPRFQLQLQKNMGQTTRNQVPITAQRDLTLPLPPLELQLQFAKTMKSVEHQRALHRQSLDASGQLFASLQHRAFRGEL